MRTSRITPLVLGLTAILVATAWAQLRRERVKEVVGRRGDDEPALIKRFVKWSQLSRDGESC